MVKVIITVPGISEIISEKKKLLKRVTKSILKFGIDKIDDFNKNLKYYEKNI